MRAKSVLFLIFVVICILVICILLHAGKSRKKSKNKETKNSSKKDDLKSKPEKSEKGEEKKVEPALKSKSVEPEKVEEKEKTLEKEPPKEKEKFHVIRKKNEIKVNKQALRSGSRNPSVTKVFDKNGKIKTEEEKVEEEKKSVDFNDEIQEKKPVERFGTREYEYSENNTSNFFQINAPKGSPLRSPTIGDRTNFTERLRVSEDGNLSGVSGIGIHGAILQAESQAKDIEDKNKEMLDRVDDSLNGQFFGDMFSNLSLQENKSEVKNPLDKIDVETLILVDAINNPRHKKK